MRNCSRNKTEYVAKYFGNETQKSHPASTVQLSLVHFSVVKN